MTALTRARRASNLAWFLIALAGILIARSQEQLRDVQLQHDAETTHLQRALDGALERHHKWSSNEADAPA